MAQYQARWSVSAMCEVLQVSRSGVSAEVQRQVAADGGAEEAALWTRVRAIAAETRHGARTGPRPSKPSSRSAVCPWPAKRLRGRRWPPVGVADRPRVSTTSPCTPRDALGRAGARARRPYLPRRSTRAQGRWPPPARPVRPVSTSTGGSSWPPMHWRRPHGRPRRCSMATKGRPRPHGGSAV